LLYYAITNSPIAMPAKSKRIPKAQGPRDSPKPQDEEMRALLDELSAMTPLSAVRGKEIYNFMGGRVLEHTTATGQVLAVKARTGVTQSEGEMMHYAATHGILAPRVRGVYDIIAAGAKRTPLSRAIVSERVPGVPLVDVWLAMSAADQASVKKQLCVQLANMRACTQPYIGRPGRQPTRNIFQSLGDTYIGPFASEKAFDNWCVRRIFGTPLMRFKWWRWLAKERKKHGDSKFVLTHGDLTPRNIIVQGNIVTGIIDWERSGFFPEYAEYAIAMMLCPAHEEWWIPVLQELLPHCSNERLEFTELVEEAVMLSPPSKN
jgi:aminoglycoside phosphotransferase